MKFIKLLGKIITVIMLCSMIYTTIGVMRYKTQVNSMGKPVVSIDNPFPGETYSGDTKLPQGSREVVSEELYETLLKVDVLREPSFQVEHHENIGFEVVRYGIIQPKLGEAETNHVIFTSDVLQFDKTVVDVASGFILEIKQVQTENDGMVSIKFDSPNTLNKFLVFMYAVTAGTGGLAALMFLPPRVRQKGDEKEEGEYFDPDTYPSENSQR